MVMKSRKLREIENWMLRNARPLELARWRYHMKKGRKAEVLCCLKAFQNVDGGFGHGIEPDFWNPGSTPMASWSAAQILKEINLDPDEEIIKKLIDYLLKTINPNTGMWASTVPENNYYPHAPWWKWRRDIQLQWMFNPTVELSAYLIYWSVNNHENRKIGWAVMKKAIDYLMQQGEMDFHELKNFKNALEILGEETLEFNRQLPYNFNQAKEKVWELIKDSMDRNYENWGKDYQPLPLDFINVPEEMNNIRDLEIEFLVEKNLKYYEESLKNEGTWDITWEWEEYPEAFPVAKRNWQGILTVERCKTLKAFGRYSNQQ